MKEAIMVRWENERETHDQLADDRQRAQSFLAERLKGRG